jgi:hypothetical protein
MRHFSITNSVVCTAEEIGPSEEIPRMNAGKGLSDIQKIGAVAFLQINNKLTDLPNPNNVGMNFIRGPAE